MTMTAAAPHAVQNLSSRLMSGLAGLFDVEDISSELEGRDEVVRFRGHFRVEAEQAYEPVKAHFATLGYTPMFRREEGREVVIAMPGTIEADAGRVRTNIIMFLLTLASVILVGTLNALGYYGIGSDQMDPGAVIALVLGNLWLGVPYAVLLDEKAHLARDRFSIKVLPTIFINDSRALSFSPALTVTRSATS